MDQFDQLWEVALQESRNSRLQDGPPASGEIETPAPAEPPENSEPGAAPMVNPVPSQNHMDILVYQVSNNLSEVMMADPEVSKLNLGQVFKKAFTYSGFQKTAPRLTPSMAARSISNLAAGIFSGALAGMDMDRARAEKFFLKLLSAIHSAFSETADNLGQMSSLSEPVRESLDSSLSLTREFLKEFYSSTPLPSLQESPRAQEKPEAVEEQSGRTGTGAGGTTSDTWYQVQHLLAYGRMRGL